jgi:hypothetical protein
MTRRSSIRHAAPGHAPLSTSGSARNVFVRATALGRWADVTVGCLELVELARARRQVKNRAQNAPAER